MAGEWREFVFADLIQTKALEIGDGYRAKNSELGGDGPIFLRAGHVRDTHIDFEGVARFHRELAGAVAAKMSRRDDVIVTTKGNSTGRTSYVGDRLPPFVYSPHLSYWRSLDPDRIVPGFLRYWSRSQEFWDQLAGLAASTDMAPYLSLVDQKRLRIVLPPAPEQRVIAHILGTLDDKIELNRRMSETLEAMARALFKSWFVDFDPVRAKAEGREPGLPKPLADLFPGSFEDSGLGGIPAGWSVGPILTQAQLLSGGTPKTDRPDYWDGDIPWAAAKDVSQCGQAFLVKTEHLISHKGLEESAAQMIPRLATVVVARGATTGRMVLLGRQMAMNQMCYALESTSGTPFALYGTLRSEIDRLVHAAHGSVFDTVTTSTFASSRVILPPTLLLKVYETLSAPLFHRVLMTTEESQTLASLRDALLPTLISGEVRIKDAETLAAGRYDRGHPEGAIVHAEERTATDRSERLAAVRQNSR
jgi:type I restriction enzyme, S subunit